MQAVVSLAAQQHSLRNTTSSSLLARWGGFHRNYRMSTIFRHSDVFRSGGRLNETMDSTVYSIFLISDKSRPLHCAIGTVTHTTMQVGHRRHGTCLGDRRPR